jgi:hypothetical protein
MQLVSAVPLGAMGVEQVPPEHVPAVWHGAGGGQVTAAPPVHTPAWQASPVVQAFPSVQGVVLGFAGLEQIPVPVSHVPALWHWSNAAQVTGLEPTQMPF